MALRVAIVLQSVAGLGPPTLKGTRLASLGVLFPLVRFTTLLRPTSRGSSRQLLTPLVCLMAYRARLCTAFIARHGEWPSIGLAVVSRAHDRSHRSVWTMGLSGGMHFTHLGAKFNSDENPPEK